MPSPQAWRCEVCGYVHRSPDAPEECPVCGASKREFAAYSEPSPGASSEAQASKWRCMVCNYEHSGAEPPAECPVCGALKDSFEPENQETIFPAAAAGLAGVARILVLGAGIAGVSAVESLRRRLPEAEITLVSKETELPYYRLNLTRYLAGEIGEEDLTIHPERWYQENRVTFLRGAEVSELIPDKHVAQLLDGSLLAFDKLILAMGAHPFMPPFATGHWEGLTPLRTKKDAHYILERLTPGIPCVCIGGGLLGLETAGALARRGAKVTVLEGHEWLMPRQLSPLAGRRLEQWLNGLGIAVRKQARTKQILGQGRVSGVLLENGETIPAELVVIAAGIRPNTHLARRAGLEVASGVVVNNHLVTSHPDVLAAGDVAEHNGVVYGVWGPSQFQGGIAGMNALSPAAQFGGIPRSNALKVLGIEVFSIGLLQPEDASYSVIEEDRDEAYYRFVFYDGRLAGAILVGDASSAGVIKKAIEGRRDLSLLLQGQAHAADIIAHLENQ
ncbi:MAG: FAD-dependent oxidoreductase [Candidatus Sumerlaeota bacterium]|nr:FAD-dependent oxidoreductase [Candidatus Sumerlaeota bacterium]